MCVAFLPFPTALLADFVRGTYAQRTTAVAVYSGTLALTAILSPSSGSTPRVAAW